ncbi:hypothetical protein PF005_g18176 [Phytophthora fragariae]|uniref:Uncharacterized protein n=1 Tax=Phytophthora fragariae TaxID=53985 RepID=A0A6A3YE52_9STRA|nr:hypothetical protein PF009_g19445 [Phytophthora fragariae]KAE8972990.1 hypothetical protein PF011_g25431 [Phytophthora fragariae]KAE9092049.1 hypothetical protein PF010_g17957 [Phytophthora fragariae]KAE9123220.1 hypothetical protein PF006_g17470 [Phytophthora fragariae]KAE9193184.1 hypothetical protein PF005_g18176 [Phytophthora fragariae]
MLDAAMKRRYAKMARQFFQRRSDLKKHKYVVAARRVHQISVMRWMLENGAPLDVATAINISLPKGVYDTKQKDYTTYFEVTWWLKENDRVALVVEGLSDKNHHKLLLWVLQNTFFQLDSRLAIRRAIKSAPRDTIEWLFENLLDPAIRTWCFED